MFEGLIAPHLEKLRAIAASEYGGDPQDFITASQTASPEGAAAALAALKTLSQSQGWVAELNEPIQGQNLHFVGVAVPKSR